MKEKTTQLWVPIYVDKWIFGSTRLELDVSERSVFLDLMLLGAKDDGYIRANETMGYLPRQLAGLLNITEELLITTISKCKKYAKIEEPMDGIYRICKWDEYQFAKSYVSEIDNGKKPIPGSEEWRERTKSSLQRTKSSLIGKDRIGEDKKREDRTTRPTLEQVRAYCKERGNGVNAEKWMAYYESKGWVVGHKSPMKDWKAAVRTWELSDISPNSAPKRPQVQSETEKQAILAHQRKKSQEEAVIYFERKNASICTYCNTKKPIDQHCICQQYQQEYARLKGEVVK